VGFFPLDRQLGISSRGWSERIEKQVIKLTARGDSFGEAVADYEDLIGLRLLKTTAWERTQERGERLRKKRMAQAEKAWEMPKRQAIMPGEALEGVNKAVSMDGVTVYILEEGWKEVKVGCVFEFETQAGYRRRRQEKEDLVKATHQTYTAYLGGPEEFSRLLSAEAERRGYDQALKRASVGDGAKWIWNLSGLCFPTSWEIVDWYHALDHLWEVSGLVYGEGSASGKGWVKGRENDLWLGQVPSVIKAIEALTEGLSAEAQEEVQSQAGYFRNNTRRMQYQEFREEGYPLGSGTVESGCKNLVTKRMKGPGMRWSRPGAQNMLALRAEYLSHRWNEAWQLTLAA
jgi:hypothetical protein